MARAERHGRSVAVRFAGIALAMLATPALALPPSGVYRDGAEHNWWECQVQPVTKLICCRASDGHVLRDDEWRAIEKPDGGRASSTPLVAGPGGASGG
jgi:hypothetical protein